MMYHRAQIREWYGFRETINCDRIQHAVQCAE